MIKLSVNEIKWSSLLTRTRAFILYISIWIFDFGPEKFPGLSRNGPRITLAYVTWGGSQESRNTGSRGDVFVIRTSKPVENLWKMGYLWSLYSFVTHSIDRKPSHRSLRYLKLCGWCFDSRISSGLLLLRFRSHSLPSPSDAFHSKRSHVVQVSFLVLSFTRHFVPRSPFGHPSGEVPCASEDMACGYWFSKVDRGGRGQTSFTVDIPLG